VALPLPLAAAEAPARAAIVWGRQRVPYSALARMAAVDARRLARWVEPGDRVALVMDPSPRFVALFHGAGHLRAIVAPVSPSLGPGDLAAALELLSPAVVVADPASRAAAAEAAPPGTPVVADLDGYAPLEVPLVAEGEADAPLAIVLTSGTSGGLKGVVLSHGNFAASARASARRLGQEPTDRWLAAMPLAHIGGLAILWRSAKGATTVVLHRRFRALEVADSLVRDKVTLLSVVPTMLRRLLAAQAEAPPRLRAVLVGGAGAPPRLIDDALAAGYPLALTYGLTEAASQVATAAPGEVRPGEGVAARPVDGVQIRIAGGEGQGDGVGEILVKGPMVMVGYWRTPDATARALAGGWLHTGDIGHLDSAGRLHVLGRVDDMIKTGGEKVAPSEVEAAIAAHPRVADCAVAGIPSLEWGTAVAAAVVRRPGGAVSTATLEAFLRRRLAPHKVPKRIVWLPSLPRNASGKIDRRAVARLTGRGGD